MLVTMTKTFRQMLEERIASVYGGSAADFARATGFTPQTVSSWRKGRVTLPQPAARRRLATEFGVSHVELLSALGELEPSEVSLPPDPRSDAVRRLQPLIDQVAWTEGLLAEAEDHLRFLGKVSRGAFQGPKATGDMKNAERANISEFDEDEE